MQKITSAQLCEITGIGDRRHRQLAEEGYFPHPDKGEYELLPTFAGMMRYMKEQVHKKDDTLATERKLYTQARREKVKLETEILRRKWIPVSEIGPILRNVGIFQRATFQNALENELPPKLAGLDPIAIKQRMRETVDTVCGIFEDAAKRWDESKPGGGLDGE